LLPLTSSDFDILQRFQDWEWKIDKEICERTKIITTDHNPLDTLQAPVQKLLWEQIQSKLTSD
jgi:hypothetical protein